jgi:peptidoglycan/xylan/chitin deacetylase (PgdA/CDA1 family)
MSERLDILTFHRIMPVGMKYFIPPMAMNVRTFSSLIDRLAANNRFIALEEGVRLLREGQLHGNKIAITFDDGYLDNFDLARDVLQRLGAPATFFVPIVPIEKQTVYWWDHLFAVMVQEGDQITSWVRARPYSNLLRSALEDIGEIAPDKRGARCRRLVQALNGLSEEVRGTFIHDLSIEFGPYSGDRLLMTWKEIQQLQTEGFAIGSHSFSHIPLTDLDEQAAGREIRNSANFLEKILGQRPSGFCYPRGQHSQQLGRSVEMAGYTYAVTTRFGSNQSHTDRFALARRNMSDFTGIRNHFPVTMHLVELSGILDGVLAARRAG